MGGLVGGLDIVTDMAVGGKLREIVVVLHYNVLIQVPRSEMVLLRYTSHLHRDTVCSLQERKQMLKYGLLMARHRLSIRFRLDVDSAVIDGVQHGWSMGC
jgi:hypothetical protein